MPIYEYRCRECGFQKEFLQRMNDVPMTDCPACGKPALDKMVSAAGFKLKGTGWYATDFKNSGAKPAAKTEKSEVKTGKPADSATPASKQDQPAAAQDKPAAAKDKPAESSSKESSKTESSTSAGAAQT